MFSSGYGYTGCSNVPLGQHEGMECNSSFQVYSSDEGTNTILEITGQPNTTRTYALSELAGAIIDNQDGLNITPEQTTLELWQCGENFRIFRAQNQRVQNKPSIIFQVPRHPELNQQIEDDFYGLNELGKRRDTMLTSEGRALLDILRPLGILNTANGMKIMATPYIDNMFEMGTMPVSIIDTNNPERILTTLSMITPPIYRQPGDDLDQLQLYAKSIDNLFSQKPELIHDNLNQNQKELVRNQNVISTLAIMQFLLSAIEPHCIASDPSFDAGDMLASFDMRSFMLTTLRGGITKRQDEAPMAKFTNFLITQNQIDPFTRQEYRVFESMFNGHDPISNQINHNIGVLSLVQQLSYIINSLTKPGSQQAFRNIVATNRFLKLP